MVVGTHRTVAQEDGSEECFLCRSYHKLFWVRKTSMSQLDNAKKHVETRQCKAYGFVKTGFLHRGTSLKFFDVCETPGRLKSACHPELGLSLRSQSQLVCEK